MSLPLSRAVLCLDCGQLSLLGPERCPVCAGRPLVLVSRWLDRRSKHEN